MKDIKFTKRYSLSGPEGWRKGHLYLCAYTLAQLIRVPKEVKTIYVCFHNRPRVGDFKIVRRDGGFHIFNMEQRAYGLDRNVSLTLSVRKVLMTAYKRGLKYVRVEY